MPLIKKCTRVPKGLVSFSDLNRAKIEDGLAVHFFLHDQMFERVWRQIGRYTTMLSKYKLLLSPDFSAYMGMHTDMINFNILRSRILGSWWQMNGNDVIPSVTWAGVSSYDKCFSGIEPGGTVAIGSCPRRDRGAANRWRAGFYEMCKRLAPKDIIIYGSDEPYDLDVDADIHFFANPYIERMRRTGNGR